MSDLSDLNKDHLLKENEDYALVPLDNDPDAWAIRFLNGPFVETVIQYGVVTMDGKEGALKFNYEIVSSPDAELTTEDKLLASHATKVLCSLIVQSIEDDAAEITEVP